MYVSVKWRGKHVTQSSELHAAHAFMGPKRLVMKFDKLLSVIVRRCEKHVYFKLTNKRPTDTSFIDKRCLLMNNRLTVPMMYLSGASSYYKGCMGKQINGQFNHVLYANINH